MTVSRDWRPGHRDPLFILAMDHRDSFGSKLYGVKDDDPTDDQLAAMQAGKGTIYGGLRAAADQLGTGTAGVLVDEQYGQSVIDAAGEDSAVALAVPIEASGQEWFRLQWGDRWLDHVDRIRPNYAKVLVRDNPAFDPAERAGQLDRLAAAGRGLAAAGVPLLYELLVPASDDQKAQVGGDTDAYDRDLRPDLVAQVIRDNQEHGVHPALWKVEGLETVDAARAVAAQVAAGADDAALIVLGRDAPEDRLDHWLEVASQVDLFVGFAIGRSIWEDVLADKSLDQDTATQRIADRYLGFTRHWKP